MSTGDLSDLLAPKPEKGTAAGSLTRRPLAEFDCGETPLDLINIFQTIRNTSVCSTLQLRLIEFDLPHFFASSAAAAALGGSVATPPSMQLRHLLSTHPSTSWSPWDPRCRPPHSRAIIPATTPSMVMTASTTTRVSIEWGVEERPPDSASITTTGGDPTSGGSWLV
ncbi:hypothetical protein STAS_01491 [Striga asiatica]|uniref:Uncharacterized protein n=1 Tax=Striga asiatica TaxID=4170 RepID=A0A5A7P029_STRAF|nr:hypothetical protein STAS_01491 [Striga asiatica]